MQAVSAGSVTDLPPPKAELSSVKNRSPWDGLTLEKFVKNTSPEKKQADEKQQLWQVSLWRLTPHRMAGRPACSCPRHHRIPHVPASSGSGTCGSSGGNQPPLLPTRYLLSATKPRTPRAVVEDAFPSPQARTRAAPAADRAPGGTEGRWQAALRLFSVMGPIPSSGARRLSREDDEIQGKEEREKETQRKGAAASR